MNMCFRRVFTAFILLLAFSNQAIGYSVSSSCLYGANNDVVTSNSINMEHNDASYMLVLKMPNMDKGENCDGMCTCPTISCGMAFVLPSTLNMSHQYSTFNKFVSNSSRSARHIPSENYRPPK